MRRIAPLPLLFALLAPCLACAGRPHDVNRKMTPYLRAGDADGALSVLEDSGRAYGEKNELLYRLEEGMLLHYLGRWQESNEAFERAKRVAEANYTKSITRELGTYLVNENTVPYYGEPYERSLIHLFCALNYAALGDLEAALVEARQMDAFLRKLDVDGVSGTFQDDGFGRWLSAMLYEESGQLDEAFVAYKLALDAYAAQVAAYGVSAPERLKLDATRVASELGAYARAELAARLSPVPDSVPASASAPVPASVPAPAPAPDRVPDPEPLPEGEGRLVLVHYSGLAPHKIEVTINVTVGKGWAYVNRIEGNTPGDDRMARAQGAALGALSRESFQVALPKYVRTPHRIAAVVAEGSDEAVSEPVADIGTEAVKTLEDDIGWIQTRAIARAALKYVLARLAEEGVRQSSDEAGEALALATRMVLGVARNVSEEADTRSWFTVPDAINLLELVLPAGTHDVELRFVDAQGATVSSRVLHAVPVESGRRTFRVVRTVR